MLYMVIESFRDGNASPVYRRFRNRGRLASWVATDLARYYQIMECDDRAPLDAWIAQWSDLVDFEVETAMTSAEAVAAIARSL